MVAVVEPYASHSSHVSRSKRGEETLDSQHLICDAVCAEYVALNNACLASLADVVGRPVQDRFAVVSRAAFGEESYEMLSMSDAI